MPLLSRKRAKKEETTTRDQQHGRPHTLTYSGLVEAVKNGELEGGEWSDKRNGFSVHIGVLSDESGLTYCTKNKHPLTAESVDPGRIFVEDARDPLNGNLFKPLEKKKKIFRAIDWYMREKVPYLDPRSVVYNGRRCILLKAEFCLQRKGCSKGYDDLAALLYEQCCVVVTEEEDGDSIVRIDLETYDVSVIIFDAVFESYLEKQDPPYHHRIESVAEAFSGFPRDPVTGEKIPGSEFRDHTPQRLFSRSDLINTLTEHEGVVVCMGRAPFEHWIKIKPYRPVGLEIVAVLDTLGTQVGFDKILVASAADGEKKNCRRAVDMIDLTTIFQDYERAKQGKAYVNPASIRRDPVSGVIDCKSSSSLAPMISALFGHISLHGGRLVTPSFSSSSSSKSFSSSAEVRVVVEEKKEEGSSSSRSSSSRPSSSSSSYTVKCGTKRSFHRWFRQMLFLENPVRVTMSANEFWLVPSSSSGEEDEEDEEKEEVHLQASRVLSVGRYGPVHFQNLQPVTHATLLTIATHRLDRNPHELFRLAGVSAVPFADLPATMDEEEIFMPE